MEASALTSSSPGLNAAGSLSEISAWGRKEARAGRGRREVPKGRAFDLIAQFIGTEKPQPDRGRSSTRMNEKEFIYGRIRVFCGGRFTSHNCTRLLGGPSLSPSRVAETGPAENNPLSSPRTGGGNLLERFKSTLFLSG